MVDFLTVDRRLATEALDSFRFDQGKEIYCFA
jgi:hypothetical protein